MTTTPPNLQNFWQRIQPHLPSQDFEEKKLTPDLFQIDQCPLVTAPYNRQDLPHLTSSHISPFLHCPLKLCDEMTKASAWAETYFKSNHQGNEPDKIAEIISPLLAQQPEFIKNCFHYGYHLTTLQIFFARTPEALKGLDILHLAASSKFIPESFVQCLIELNKTHRLGLLIEKGWQDKTPYEFLVDHKGLYGINPLDCIVQAKTIDSRDQAKKDTLIKIFKNNMTLDEVNQAHKRISQRFWCGVVRSSLVWGIIFGSFSIPAAFIFFLNRWPHSGKK